MKLVCPEMRVLRAFFALLAVVVLFTHGANAQAKKSAAKAPEKKAATQTKAAANTKDTAKKAPAKTAAKTPAKTASKTPAKDTKGKAADARSKAPEKGKNAAKNDPKAKAADKRTSAREKAKDARTAKKDDPKDKKNPKRMTAAERRKEEARRKAEEERRQAALAEQRRREQAAREARARKLAFEKGLRTETAANILNDNIEGEDLTVRRVAINALGERAGTVVVMEAKTGKIVTMVNQDWAIKEGFKPCSTIKLVTGVAGLNENIVDPDGNISGDSMRMDLDDALAYSNNPYFQRVGVKMGNEKMIGYARQLGLGEKTGINADGEFAGKLPYGNSNPRIYSHADDFEVTPLQLAVMVTALSNGGKRIVPQVQRAGVERTAFRPKYKGEIDLPDTKFRRVIPGMIGAAEYGTARRGVEDAWGVAGKTGSCIGRGSWVGLFASVAPVEDPVYSVVVITRGEGERGRIAAGIAGQIYRSLAPRLRRDQERFLALKNQGSRSTGSDNTMLAAVGDDEEEDDNTAELDAIPEGPRRPIIVGSQDSVEAAKPRPGVVRTTQSRPAQPRPNFSPVIIPYSKDRNKPASASKPAEKPAVEKSRPRVVKNR